MSDNSLSLAAPTPSYWRDTLRPWPNLVFVIPWLLVYEVGVLLAQTPTTRNGADAWLRTTLITWGAPGGWVLPAGMVLCLLAWQLGSQQSWRLTWETLLGMLAESLLFACGLILLGQTVELAARQSGVIPVQLSQSERVSTPLEAQGLQSLGFPGQTLNVGQSTTLKLPVPLPPLGFPVETSDWSTPLPSPPLRLLGFLGAGIYEEFLFRLCLVPAVYLLLRGLLIPARWSLFGSVAATSVIFALAHYLVPTGDMTALSVLSDAMAHVQSRRELWFGFGFRVMAGLIFAVLFCWRGFGIAVGTHAVYDVVVGWVLVSEI